MLPLLYQKYPNLGVELIVTSRQSPHVQFMPTALTATHAFELLFNVVTETSQIVPAFLLETKITASLGKVGIVSTGVASFNVTGSVQDFGIALTLNTSYIGDFDVKNLNNMLLIIVKNGIVAAYNRTLLQGNNNLIFNNSF